MKKTYEKPTLVNAGSLPLITAVARGNGNGGFISIVNGS